MIFALRAKHNEHIYFTNYSIHSRLPHHPRYMPKCTRNIIVFSDLIFY